MPACNSFINRCPAAAFVAALVAFAQLAVHGTAPGSDKDAEDILASFHKFFNDVAAEFGLWRDEGVLSFTQLLLVRCETFDDRQLHSWTALFC